MLPVGWLFAAAVGLPGEMQITFSSSDNQSKGCQTISGRASVTLTRALPPLAEKQHATQHLLLLCGFCRSAFLIAIPPSLRGFHHHVGVSPRGVPSITSSCDELTERIRSGGGGYQKLKDTRATQKEEEGEGLGTVRKEVEVQRKVLGNVFLQNNSYEY